MERERQEPKFSKPDMTEVSFGISADDRRPGRPPASDNSLVWKIAAGVFIGMSLCVLATCSMFGLGAAMVANEQEKAQKAAVDEFIRATKDPDPFGINDQINARQQAERQAERDARALKAGQRCIGGKRYERIEGGWRDIPNAPC